MDTAITQLGDRHGVRPVDYVGTEHRLEIDRFDQWFDAVDPTDPSAISYCVLTA